MVDVPVCWAGVQSAIRELDKTIPRAGFGLIPVFFPALARVDRERFASGGGCLDNPPRTRTAKYLELVDLCRGFRLH